MKIRAGIYVAAVLGLGVTVLFLGLPRCMDGGSGEVVFVEESDLEPMVTPVLRPPVVLPVRAVDWASINDAGQPAMRPPRREDLQKVAPYPEAELLGDGSLTPQQEIEVVSQLFRFYMEAFGSLPTGEGNAQFMNALRGNNAKHLGFFPFEHSRLDAQGQLVDSWGEPYFFHVLSRSQLEIRSAGRDRELYTEDDQVLR
ncbi:hypothetical protein P3T73_13250 [Kiritimatiellota bacterium B12222]|nr:hypothetical protein P3T73_13250 [Kiritimatiellota bacterium B12222]